MALGKRDEEVKIRALILVTSRQRTVKHRQANPVLCPQRPAKLGEERPMGTQILTLTRRQAQPPRAWTGGAQGALRDSSTQSALLNLEVSSQILDHAHARKATTTYVRYGW